MSGERGFTIVEVLTAVLVVATGVLGTFGVFGSSNRSSVTAQRQSVASGVAHRELEKLRGIDYDKLALNATGSSAQDAAHPWRVASNGMADRLYIAPGVGPYCAAGGSDCGYEPAVIGNDATPGAVAPTSTYTVAATNTPGVNHSSAAVRVSVYRYVTWRDENCATGVCDGVENTKRIAVAVKATDSPGFDQKPIWLFSVAGPRDVGGTVTSGSQTPAGNSTVKGQRFYLYDNSCYYTYPRSPAISTLDHPTSDTAANGGATAANYSACVFNAARRADALDARLAPNTADPGLPATAKYSDDLAGSYKGLMMSRNGATAETCESGLAPHDYPAGTPNASGANKWNVHRWMTQPFNAPFTIQRKVALSMFASSLANTPGRGVICVTLLARRDAALASDTRIGSWTIDRDPWNVPGQTVHFTSPDLSMPDANPVDGQPDVVTIPENSRLVLAVSVRSSSAHDLILQYAHPLYRAYLSVQTSTACNANNLPCQE